MNYGEGSSNGLLLTLIDFAIQEYGWQLSYTLDTSMVWLMMLMRQKIAAEGKGGLSLLDQEKIDNNNNGKSWEQLLEENRKQLMKYKIT